MNLKKETNLQTKLQNSEVDNQLEELLTEIPEAFGQEGDEALTLVNYISEESVELIHATIARPLCGCERFLAQTNKLFPSLILLLFCALFKKHYMNFLSFSGHSKKSIILTKQINYLSFI